MQTGGTSKHEAAALVSVLKANDKTLLSGKPSDKSKQLYELWMGFSEAIPTNCNGILHFGSILAMYCSDDGDPGRAFLLLNQRVNGIFQLSLDYLETGDICFCKEPDIWSDRCY